MFAVIVAVVVAVRFVTIRPRECGGRRPAGKYVFRTCRLTENGPITLGDYYDYYYYYYYCYGVGAVDILLSRITRKPARAAKTASVPTDRPNPIRHLVLIRTVRFDQFSA